MDVIVAIVLMVVCFFGGGVTGWIIKPPQAVTHITEVKTESALATENNNVMKSYQITINVNTVGQEKPVQSITLNIANLTNVQVYLLTNTNYYASKTN